MFFFIVLQLLATATLATPLLLHGVTPIEQFAQLLVNPNHCDISSDRGIRACTDKLDIEVTSVFEVSSARVPQFIMNTDPDLFKILPTSFINEHAIGICGRTADMCMNSLLSFSVDTRSTQNEAEIQHELMSRDNGRYVVVTYVIAFVGLPGLTTGGLVYAITGAGASAALLGFAASSLMVYLLETRRKPY